jgi:hypothetical protein
MDDSDLDSAALWAAIDSAAAKASSRIRCAASDDDHRGEVLQPARPFKNPRLVSASHATPPPPAPLPLPSPSPSPRLHASPYTTPDAAAARNRLQVVESPPPHELWGLPMASPIAAAYDGGLLPSLSVANFKNYQDVALSVRPTPGHPSPHPPTVPHTPLYCPVNLYLFYRLVTLCKPIECNQ